MLSKIPIKIRYVIIFLILSLSPVLILGTWLFQETKGALEETARKHLVQIANKKAVQIYSFMHERSSALESLSDDPYLQNSFARLLQSDRNDQKTKVFSNKIKSRFKQLSRLRGFENLLMICRNHRLFFSVHPSDNLKAGKITQNKQNSILLNLISQIETTLTTTSTPVYLDQTTGKPTLYIATPVIIDNLLAGVLVAQISTKELKKTIFDNIGMGDSGETILARKTETDIEFPFSFKHNRDIKPKLLSHMNSEDGLKPMARALMGERGSGFIKDYNAKEVISVWRYLPSIHSGMVVKTGIEEAYVIASQFYSQWFFVLALLILGTILMSYFFANSIVMPIRALFKASQRIAAGDLTEEVSIRGEEEFQKLAGAFNLMMQEVKNSREELEEKVHLRTQELEEANRSLKSRQEVLRKQAKAIDDSPAMVVITDLQSRIQYANPAFTTITGYRLAEVIGKHTRILASGKTPEKTYQEMWNTLQFGASWKGELLNRKKDGTEYWASISISPVRNEAGETINFISLQQDITENKNLQNALIEQTTNLLRAQQVAKLGTWQWEIETGNIIWSEEVYRIYGMDPEQGSIDYNTYVKHIHPDDVEEVLKTIRLTLNKTGSTYKIRYRILTLEGKERVIDAVGDLERDNAGNPIKLWGIVQDVTEQTQLERALMEQTRILNNAQKIARLGNWEWNVSSDQIVWSDEAYRIHGEIQGHFVPSWDSVLNKVLPEDQEQVGLLMKKGVLSPEEPIEMEYRIQTRDQQMKNLHLLGSVITDSSGVPIKVQGTIQDITERKKTEHELQRYQSHLEELVEEKSANIKAIVDTAADAIITINYSGLIISCNRSAEKMFGAPSDKILGSSIDSFIGYMNENFHEVFIKPGIDPDDSTVITSGQETIGRKANGETFAINISISQMRLGEETRFTVITRDMTELVETQKALIKAKEKAETANQAKSAFIANISHEIRTPMNAVIGMTDLVLETDLKPEQEKYLTSVSSASKSLLDLINDVLDFSKLESHKMSFESIPFNLHHLIENTMTLMQNQAVSKGLELNSMIQDGVPQCVQGDPARLRQVLVNLTGNALKFTPVGSISLEVYPDDDNKLHFHVKDTGIGISEERLPYIFDRFTQADESISRKFGGTGLGTSLSKEIIEQQGGKIWVESREGEGSDFQFILNLPEAEPDQCSEAVYTGFENVRINKSLSVLVAEDVPMNQELLSIRLKQHGHLVQIADNGKIALDLFQNSQFDIILMDVMMPEMDGLEATRRIRDIEKEKEEHIPIIMLTAGVLEEEVQAYADAGADDFAGKPIDFQELFSVMAKHFPDHLQIEMPADHPDKFSTLLPIPGVDLQRGLKIWDNESAYKKALINLGKKYHQIPGELRYAFEQNDLESFKNLTHKFKGASGNLGFSRMLTLLTACEENIKLDQNAVPRLLNEIETAMQNYLDALQNYIGDPAGKGKSIRIRFTDAARQALQQLQLKLQNNSIDDKLMRVLSKHLSTSDYQELEELIDQFEFKKAVTFIADLFEADNQEQS